MVSGIGLEVERLAADGHLVEARLLADWIAYADRTAAVVRDIRALLRSLRDGAGNAPRSPPTAAATARRSSAPPPTGAGVGAPLARSGTSPKPKRIRSTADCSPTCRGRRGPAKGGRCGRGDPAVGRRALAHAAGPAEPLQVL